MMRAKKKFKLGLILILVGFFMPTSLLPFVSEYRPGASLLANIQEMRLILGSDKIPVFRPVAEKRGLFADLFEEYSYEEVPVNVGDTTFTFEFPEIMTESEREEILDRKLEGTDSKVIEGLKAELAGKDRLRFKWEVRPVALRYRYPLVCGMILVFLGTVFLVLSIGSGAERTEPR